MTDAGSEFQTDSASEMTYIVLSGALNSTHYYHSRQTAWRIERTFREVDTSERLDEQWRSRRACVRRVRALTRRLMRWLR